MRESCVFGFAKAAVENHAHARIAQMNAREAATARLIAATAPDAGDMSSPGCDLSCRLNRSAAATAV